MNDQTSNPVSAQPKSYVDSYQPPSGNAQTTQPAQQSDPLAELEKLLKENEAVETESNRKKTSKPEAKTVTDHSPKKKDPLKELEIALKNYEDRKKQLKSESIAPKRTPKPVADPKKPNNSEQSLKELEKLLLEYEDRRKDKTGGRPQPKMDLKPQPKPDSKPQPNFERVAAAPAPAINPPSVEKKSNNSKQSLKELEKLLLEYEDRRKDKTSERSQLKFERAADALAPQKPATPPAPAINPPSVEKKSSQSIENQNIFELIGANDSNDKEKEAFLDELQEAIWEDFLNKDIELLVTAEELKQLQDLRSQASKNKKDVQLQEKLINEVEKLIPDVEDIMLEKALELKEDLAWERVTGMKEYYLGRSEALQKIEEASVNFKKGQWQAGALILNALVP